MDKSNKQLLLDIEKAARKQRSFTVSSLSEEFPKDDKHEKAINAFVDSAIVRQSGGRRRCVPTGQRGGTKKLRWGFFARKRVHGICGTY